MVEQLTGFAQLENRKTPTNTLTLHLKVLVLTEFVCCVVLVGHCWRRQHTGSVALHQPLQSSRALMIFSVNRGGLKVVVMTTTERNKLGSKVGRVTASDFP